MDEISLKIKDTYPNPYLFIDHLQLLTGLSLQVKDENDQDFFFRKMIQIA